MELVGCLALIAIGMMLGSLGSGGSILAMPVLVYLFSIDVIDASAYAMFLVGITSSAGVVLKHKTQLVDLRAGIVFGLPSILAVIVARRWAIPALPDVISMAHGVPIAKRVLLLILLAALMITSAMILLLRKGPPKEITGKRRVAPLACAGALTGFFAGMAGIGGGFIILPSLIFFARIPFRNAVGTALLIIAANSLLGFLGTLYLQPLDWQFLSLITLTALFGLFLGYRTDHFLSGFLNQKLLGWLSLSIGIAMLLIEL